MSWKVSVALCFQVLIAAGTYLIAKVAVATFDPSELVLFRIVGGAPLFAALLWSLPPPRLPRRAALGTVLALGLFGGPINQGFFLAGLRLSTPNHAALLYAMTPLLVFAIAALARHERPGIFKAAGILLALSGVVVVLRERGLGDEGAVHRGDLLIFLGVLAWAVYSVWGRQLATRDGALKVTCWTMLAACAMTAPFAPLALEPAHLAAASTAAWAAVAYLVVFTSFVAYLLWYFALERSEASRVTVWSNLQPVVTASLGWAVFAAPVSPAFAAGGALVVGGVLLTQRG